MNLEKREFYQKDSSVVENAKLGRFKTVIIDCYPVNGRKYRPDRWRKEIFEVVTSDGTFICKNDVAKYIGSLVQVFTAINFENSEPFDINWKWIAIED